MAYEQFANGGLSSLDAAIDSDDTSLTVKSAVGFPTIGNFRIIVESEIMLVTDVQGKTFTVTRAQEGTSAASHDADIAVFHTLTAGALAQRDVEQFGRGAFADRDAAGQAGRLYLPTSGLLGHDTGSTWNSYPLNRLKPPVIGAFTWVNQGTATVTDTNGMTVLATPNVSSGENLRLLVKSTPSTPYTVTACILPQSPIYTSNGSYAQFGLCWRDSSSGKIITYGWGMQNYPLSFSYDQWTNYTTISANQFQYTTPMFAPFWIRLTDNGTTRLAEIGSSDGIVFTPVHTPVARTTFITPDQVGFFANSWKTSNGLQRVISFLHWEEA